MTPEGAGRSARAWALMSRSGRESARWEVVSESASQAGRALVCDVHLEGTDRRCLRELTNGLRRALRPA